MNKQKDDGSTPSVFILKAMPASHMDKDSAMNF
jgi:hypothetical protein